MSAAAADNRLRVLVTGADGFIGRQIVAALRAAGHHVLSGVRPSVPRIDRPDLVSCDFATDLAPADWLARLRGVVAVVNCVGILRDRGDSSFESVHVKAPAALYQACAASGLRRVIQVSALGNPQDGEFIASKHRGDAALMALDLDWTILRPSVVYSPHGSYGGTSLLRAMAALPGLLCVPGRGQQALDPISAEDLGALVVALLRPGAIHHRIVEAVGPETLTLEACLRAWRQWLRLPSAWRVVRVPTFCVALVAEWGEWFGDGPLGRTMNAMLERGNTGGPGAREHITSLLGRAPQRLSDSLSQRPSFVQDRWHARLYFVAPLLRTLLAIVWLGSAAVGFFTPVAEVETLFAQTVLREVALPLVYGASAVDLALGGLLLVGWRPAVTGTLMLVSVLAYTVVIGVLLPSVWLDPFGGLLKNLALLPAILVMIVLGERR